MSEKMHSAFKRRTKLFLSKENILQDSGAIIAIFCYFFTIIVTQILRDIFVVSNIEIKSFATSSAGASLEANC